MRRFGSFNKYRNATATVANREAWYSELSVNTNVSTASTGLAIDNSFIYIKSASGSSLQAIRIDSPGKVGAGAVSLSGGPGSLVDWDASPFEDGLVIGGDDKGSAVVWNAHRIVSTFEAHASSECMSTKFHPTVNAFIATAGTNEVKLWDIESTPKQVWNADLSDKMSSLSIRGDGQLVAFSTQTGSFAIADPRVSNNQNSIVDTVASFSAPGRPTHILWLGEKPFLLSTGLTRMRERSAAMWDQRNLAKPLATIQLEPSTKPLIPLYDEDTQIAYFAEKGDSILHWVGADPSDARPLTEFGSVALSSQVNGCGLLPKRCLKVMKGEIARIHAIVDGYGATHSSAVVPISHVVPRRTYLDFHADLFPETRAPFPAQNLDQWSANEPASIPRMSLDPSKHDSSLDVHRKTYMSNGADTINVNHTNPESASTRDGPATVATGNHPLINRPTLLQETTRTSSGNAVPHLIDETTALSKVVPSDSIQPKKSLPVEVSESGIPHSGPSAAAIKARAKFSFVGTSRFKYLEGYIYHPDKHFTMVHDINEQFPQENDPLKISSKYIAIVCSGPGGQVGILRRDSPGRVPTKMAKIVHGATITDMAFDPFNPQILATAGSDSRLQMWRIPDIPLTEEAIFELEEYIHVTADRINQIRFHPQAEGIIAALASDAGESAIYVYNGLMLHFIVGKTNDGIHAFSWSRDGNYIAVATKKTRRLRIYDVRTQDLIAEGPSMDSIRPCRIVWLDNQRICLVGFGVGSQRQIAIYNIDDPSTPVVKKTIDVGPGILAPIYDPDCKILYLDDRGSRLTHGFEVVGDRLVELPKYESAQPGLCLAALPKRYVDVRGLEILRAYMLNAQSLESIGFRIPRKRPEFFQDDIYPDTVDVETPALSATEWVIGNTSQPHLISLRPEGMTPLSEAPQEEVKRSKLPSIICEEDVDNTKDAINAMLSRVESDDDCTSDAAKGDDESSGSDWDD